MSRVGSLSRVLADALTSGAATMRPAERVRNEAFAPMMNRRLTDLVDMRSASALPDADFFVRRRGSAKTVGRPEPLSAREAWEALGDGPERYRSFNPAYHVGVRVKPGMRERYQPEAIYRAFEAIYNARKREFGAHAHGATQLVNIVLRDLERLYGVKLPLPEPKSAFRARVREAERHGMAQLDLRRALEAALREDF